MLNPEFQRFTSIEQPKRFSIFDYYPLTVEINFLRDQIQKGATSQDLHSYLQNNVYHFCLEFAGQAERDIIHYKIDNGNIYYPGVAEPIINRFVDTAFKKGVDSREYSEAIGFKAIRDQFVHDHANVAFWLSPPSFNIDGFGDYGYIFVLTKQSDQINEHILRYNKEDRKFTKSFNYFNNLLPYAKPQTRDISFKDERDFLKNPLFAQVDNPEKFFQNISKNLGFTKGAEESENIYRLQNDECISKWLVGFTELMIALAENKDFSLKEAGDYLTAIYNRTYDVLTTKKAETTFDINYDGQLIYRQAFQMYTRKEAVVTGGGSCPGAKSSFTLFKTIDDVMRSNHGIVNNLTANLLQLGIAEDNYFECPKCHGKIESGKGIATCPHCGITKEEYAKESGINC